MQKDWRARNLINKNDIADGRSLNHKVIWCSGGRVGQSASIHFLADFVKMDIEEDVKIPLILGHPFMLIANCVVDMGKGNLEMSVDD